MSQADAARIQSTQASSFKANIVIHSHLQAVKAQGGKDMGSGGFAARAQVGAAANTNNSAQQGNQGQNPSSNKK